MAQRTLLFSASDPLIDKKRERNQFPAFVLSLMFWQFIEHTITVSEHQRLMTNNTFTWSEWGQLDGLALAELVRCGEVSALEIAGQATQALFALDNSLESTLEVFEDVARRPGMEGSRADGVLFGVPLVLKDLGARLKGRRQESGSSLFKGCVSEWTDPFVARLLEAGLIPLGRSTTAELGLAWDTSTLHLGTPKVSRNPFDSRRTPGGSSGGSAALVAAGAVPIGSSSDGGGSTRIPASHCGLIGLKPTRGLCPRPLDSSEYISRISTDGVITRTVRDTAAVLDYSACVAQGGAFMSVGSDAGQYLSSLQQKRPSLRFAWSEGLWGRSAPIPPDISEKLREAASLLTSLDCEAVEIPQDNWLDWEALWESYTTNWISSRGQLELVAAQRGLQPEDLKDLLTPMVYRMYEASTGYDKFSLWRMMTLNNRVSRQYGSLFERIDVLVTPTYAASVPLTNGTSSTLHDSEIHEWFGRQLDAARYAILCNEVGAPAINVPAGIGRDGMPIGIQLCGRWGEERRLLQLAADIERARPDWFGAMPAIHVSRCTAV